MKLYIYQSRSHKSSLKKARHYLRSIVLIRKTPIEHNRGENKL
jgi:hypothetical protein